MKNGTSLSFSRCNFWSSCQADRRMSLCSSQTIQPRILWTTWRRQDDVDMQTTPWQHGDNTKTTQGQHKDNTRTTPRQHEDNTKTTQGLHKDNTRTTPRQHEDNTKTTWRQQQGNTRTTWRQHKVYLTVLAGTLCWTFITIRYEKSFVSAPLQINIHYESAA